MALARPVRPDSYIDVIAPSGPFDEAGFRRSIEILQGRGLRLRFRPDIFQRDRFLAGSDERRLEEIRQALHAPDSDVLWCARGGYGATRLVPELTLTEIREANKLLVGFSDITALHARWFVAGVPSIHGGMVTRFAQEPTDVADRLLTIIASGQAPPPLQGRTLTSGSVEGNLIGGNLMVLAALCGTPFQPDFRGNLLFLEDVGERPYRLDRALTQCRQAGLFDGIVGLALGEFSDCDQHDGSSTSEQVLAEHVRALGVPAIADLPSGHGSINRAIPFGVRARLNDDRLDFLAPVYAAVEKHVGPVRT